MKQHHRRIGWTAVGCLAAFVLWTVGVCCVDVQPIGLQGSDVGFATLNGAFHQFTGVHWSLYTLTDWLGLVPLATAAGFALLGLTQWIRRKRLQKVDADLRILGGFYVAVLAAFAAFELFVVNWRPVWIDGVAEASYPSSTTLLTMCVMPTALMQWRQRLNSAAMCRAVTAVGTLFVIGMVAARLVSGVHWVSDIVGGALLSTGLVLLYRFAVALLPPKAPAT